MCVCVPDSHPHHHNNWLVYYIAHWFYLLTCLFKYTMSLPEKKNKIKPRFTTTEKKVSYLIMIITFSSKEGNIKIRTKMMIRFDLRMRIIWEANFLVLIFQKKKTFVICECISLVNRFIFVIKINLLQQKKTN